MTNHLHEHHDKIKIDALNAGNLAYMGDAVFEVLVRQKIVKTTNHAKLHKIATNYVSAKAQHIMYHKLIEIATEEEKTVLKRGRNFVSRAPKSASMSEYRHATGLESLFGYLFLTGQIERINQIFNILYKYIAEENNDK